MNKIRYEIDPFNRLIVPAFRTVLDGRFRVDRYANLSYHVKSPASSKENIPNQIKLRGEWSLTGGHKLKLTLDKSARHTFGDQLMLEGGIIDVRKDSLLFAATTTSKAGVDTSYVLELNGIWRCDRSNRLSFHVRRDRGKYDILTFSGAWDIGKDKQLVYKYFSEDLLTKKRRAHSLVFNGHWDIRKKHYISYLLGTDTDSAFEFKIGTGMYGRNYIKYEVGIGLSGHIKPLKRTITIFGRWFLRRGIGLVFEVNYSGSNAHQIVFGADAKLTPKDTISLRLRTAEDNEDIGAEIELSHKLLGKDGEAFFKMLASRREVALCAGAAWRW